MTGSDVTHILIAAPDAGVRESLHALLKGGGHHVTTVATAKQTLLALGQQPCDVMIADLGLDGIDAVDLLARKPADTQIIVVTDRLAVAHALLALQAGAYDYLVKPCDEPALIAAMVERAAERCRLLRQNRTLLSALQTCSAQIDDVGCLLRELAIRDGLTGLYNHRYCHEILVIESARARRHHHGYSLLYVDIDHFRHYNDVYGHPLGDQLLRELGELLKARLRKSDIAARYGGEEFVLLLPETDHVGAAIVAEDIRQQVANHPFHPGDPTDANITVSIGIAHFPHDADSGAAVLHKAEQALAAAKHDGRNRIHHGGNTMMPSPSTTTAPSSPA